MRLTRKGDSMIRYFARGTYTDAKTKVTKRFGFVIHGENIVIASNNAVTAMEAGGHTNVVVATIVERPLIRGLHPRFSFQ